MIHALLRRAHVLVFDFDGTLVDSNPIKLRAFDRCFETFPERLPEIRAYCHAHHHTPRWEKFRYVYERILRLPYTDAIEARLSARYEQATTQAVIEAEEMPGAEAFLRAVAPRYETALLSSTPQEPLLRILDGRGWRRYFSTVQGAPVDKARWIGQLATARAAGVASMVMFGDTQEDASAAREAGCAFVAVAADDAVVPCAARIADFRVVTFGGWRGAGHRAGTIHAGAEVPRRRRAAGDPRRRAARPSGRASTDGGKMAL